MSRRVLAAVLAAALAVAAGTPTWAAGEGEALGQQLEDGFQALGEKYRRKLYLRHLGSIFVLGFGYTQDLGDFRDWLTQADLAAYQRFVAGCEDYGVRFTDRRGREYLSTAHTQEDICRTLAVADQVLGEMEQEGI